MEESKGKPTLQTPSEGTSSSTRRKLSKLQKRKKSRLRREENGLPFSFATNDQLLEQACKNISSLDDIGELSQRCVPSLTKLCLENEAIHSRYRYFREDLPRKIQTLLHNHLLEKLVKNAQLRWALNILEIAKKNHHFYFKTNPGENLSTMQVQLEPKACLSGINSQVSSEDEKTVSQGTNYIPRNCVFGTEDLDWKTILSGKV